MIELHWIALGIEKFFPKTFSELFTEKRVISIGNCEVNTFSSRDLFEYLCMHGSIHKWFRLFWLKDIVDFIHKYPEFTDLNVDTIMSRGNFRTLNAVFCLESLLFEGCDQAVGFSRKEYALVKVFLKELKEPRENISRNIFSRISRFIYFMRMSPELRVFDLMRYMYLSIAYFLTKLFVSKKN